MYHILRKYIGNFQNYHMSNMGSFKIYHIYKTYMGYCSKTTFVTWYIYSPTVLPYVSRLLLYNVIHQFIFNKVTI